jgi:virulence factor
MMDQVRVGVIGVGAMGQRHCRVYSNLRWTQLVGVCDIAENQGYEVARKYEVPFYNQLGDLLNHVDAVSLATPTPTHFDLAMRCLERGVHVLVEKPITETLEQAEKLTQVAEASGLILLVGHIERFNPAYIELKNVVEQTDMLSVNFRRLSAFEYSNNDADVIMDLMTHDIDLALDLIGSEPRIIHANGLTAMSGDVDHAIACLCFESGPLATITASRVTEHKVRSIEATMLEAYAEADLLNKNVSIHRRTIGEYLNHNKRGVKYRQESIVERIHVPTSEPLFSELQHFTDCIRRNNPPLIPARAGLETLRIAMNIRDVIGISLIDRSPTVELTQRSFAASK